MAYSPGREVTRPLGKLLISLRGPGALRSLCDRVCLLCVLCHRARLCMSACVRLPAERQRGGCVSRGRGSRCSSLLLCSPRNRSSASAMTSSWRPGRRRWSASRTTPGGGPRRARCGSTTRSSSLRSASSGSCRSACRGEPGARASPHRPLPPAPLLPVRQGPWSESTTGSQNPWGLIRPLEVSLRACLALALT